MKYTQTPFEQNIKILGNRVMLKLVLKDAGNIILPDAAKKPLSGDIMIAAIGNGPEMEAQNPTGKFAFLKVGQKITVRDMGFHELLDSSSTPKGYYRIYSAEDILAILPEGDAPSLSVVQN